MNKKHVPPADRQKIVHAYTVQQLTIMEVAALFDNYSRSVIDRILTEEGIPKRPKGVARYPYPKTHPVWQHETEVVRLYTDEKMSPRAIAKRFNCTTSPIRCILKANNVPIRTLKDARKHRPDKYGYADKPQPKREPTGKTYYRTVQRNAIGQPTLIEKEVCYTDGTTDIEIVKGIGAYQTLWG